MVTAVVILFAAIIAGVQSFRLLGAKKDLHEQISLTARMEAEYNSKAYLASDEYRRIERALYQAKEEIDYVRETEQRNTINVADAWSRDYERMRVELNENSSRDRSAPTGATCKAANDRADAARVVLEFYLRADGENAAILESQATDIRALRNWGTEVERANAKARAEAEKLNEAAGRKFKAAERRFEPTAQLDR